MHKMTCEAATYECKWLRQAALILSLCVVALCGMGQRSFANPSIAASINPVVRPLLMAEGIGVFDQSPYPERSRAILEFIHSSIRDFIGIKFMPLNQDRPGSDNGLTGRLCAVNFKWPCVRKIRNSAPSKYTDIVRWGLPRVFDKHLNLHGQVSYAVQNGYVRVLNEAVSTQLALAAAPIIPNLATSEKSKERGGGKSSKNPQRFPLEPLLGIALGAGISLLMYRLGGGRW